MDSDLSNEPKPPTPTPSTGRWHPLARVLIYAGGALILMNLAALGLILLYLVAADQTHLIRELLESGSEPDISAHVILLLTAGAAPIVWIWTRVLRVHVDRESLASLGLPRARALSNFVKGWLGGALAPALILGSGLVTGVYRIGSTEGSAMEFARIGLGPLLIFLIAFVVQGSTEELILRGYIQKNMVVWKAGRRSWLWVLLVPAILFGLGHFTNPGFGFIPFANTVLVGIFLGAIVLSGGQIWTACGVHAGWNFALAVVWSLPVSGLSTDKLLQVEVHGTGPLATVVFGGEYGPEGGLATTVLTLAAIVFAIPRAIAAFDRDAWGTRPVPDTTAR